MIDELLAQIEALSGYTEDTTANGVIDVGDTVRVVDVLRVRQEPNVSSAVVGRATTYSRGVVIDGPESSAGYVWWEVDYSDGTSGWSAENWMREVPTTVTTDKDPEIDAFEANPSVVGYMPTVVTFSWDSSDTSRCTLFRDGYVLETGLSSSGSYAYDHIGWKDGDYEKEFELRCQSAHTQKDSTVSAFVTIENEIFNEDKTEINSFSAVVTKEGDQFGPFVKFSWQTEGVSRCSILNSLGYSVSGSEGTNGTYELSRTVLNEKYGSDFINGANTFELRCQSKYTEKDSTVSAFVTVYMNISNVFATEGDMRIIIHDATAEGLARNGKSISLDGGKKVASGQWFDMFDSDIWYSDSRKLEDNTEDYQEFEGLVVERDGAKGNRFTIAHVGENDSGSDFERIQATVEVRGTDIIGVRTSSFEDHELTADSYGTHFRERSDFAEQVSDTKMQMVTYTSTGSDFVEVKVDYSVATVLGDSTSADSYTQLASALAGLDAVITRLEAMYR